MAAYLRHPARSLIEDLIAEPQHYELLQALAILERFEAPAVPLGEGMDPDLESLTIEQDPTLAFSASDVSSLRLGENGKAVLRTAIMGLSGQTGPLPVAYTESMLERVFRRDKAWAAFLDMFNHRLVSLFYRTRRATLPLLDGNPERSVLGAALHAFIGIGTHGLRNRVPGVGDRMLLGFAGIFAERRRGATSLAAVLSGVLQTPCTVRSFVGRWLPLSADSVTQLSRTAPAEARTLGSGAMIGSRVWDQHAGFAVDLRFERLTAFETLLPAGAYHQPILSLCRFHGGPLNDVVLDMTLAARAIPPLKLSSKGGARLGWTTWLLGKDGAAKSDGRVRLTIAVPEGNLQ